MFHSTSLVDFRAPLPALAQKYQMGPVRQQSSHPFPKRQDLPCHQNSTRPEYASLQEIVWSYFVEAVSARRLDNHATCCDLHSCAMSNSQHMHFDLSGLVFVPQSCRTLAAQIVNSLASDHARLASGVSCGPTARPLPRLLLGNDVCSDSSFTRGSLLSQGPASP